MGTSESNCDADTGHGRKLGDFFGDRIVGLKKRSLTFFFRTFQSRSLARKERTELRRGGREGERERRAAKLSSRLSEREIVDSVAFCIGFGDLEVGHW